MASGDIVVSHTYHCQILNATTGRPTTAHRFMVSKSVHSCNVLVHRDKCADLS